MVSRKKGLTIYLSHLRIKKGGAIDIDGIDRTFQGSAIAVGEARAASTLGNLFNFLIPGLENQHGILRALSLRDVAVSIEVSPLNESDIPRDQTIVTVGSPGYNLVSKWAENNLNPLIRFDNENSEFKANTMPPVTDLKQGMVQVLWDADNNRRVFYVAGLSEQGTVAALLYLSLKWDDLSSNLGKNYKYACFVRLNNGHPTICSTVHPA
jgi:acyl-CoA synthetase (NDP forming)